MTKIDIFSGFLGAGKTTLIKKLIKEAYSGEKLVLIENEFGDIGIDGGFLAEAGIKINELNSGCICCSLVGDFAKALNKVYEEYHPDRILIEPSGVGKLSDVIKAVYSAELPDSVINTYTAVVDAAKCKMYMKNFGEFFNDQIETANCIVFSHADVAGEEKLAKAAELVREHNAKATLVTTPWQELDGKDILAAMEHSDTLTDMLAELKEHCHEHHHHHDDDEDEHEHHHHDDDDEHEHHHHDDDDEHEHHHHDDDDEHEHHHHEHDEECGCGHHHDHEHEHHHHHHADEVFESWGVETAKSFTKEELTAALSSLTNSVQYGTVLRAKGIVKGKNGGWLHFDYVPGEPEVRDGCAAYTGRLCVIGSKIDKEELAELFGV
ncbi:MAG: GTP-binding protein [Clostridia bacterium]|nr:GTP-binding protein [Clostridia bacterium]